MNIWTECKKIPLPKALSFIVDNRGKTVPIDEEGEHILIATNCIRNEKLFPSYEKIRRLSEETYQNWFRAHPLPGDIIFVCKGTPGRTCMVPDPVDFCIAQDMVALRANEKIIYNKFLLVILRSWQLQEQIANTSVGDVIPHFKKQFFDQLMIPIPPMDVQKKIGDIYFEMSLLEEKNDEISENLSQQAQAIYTDMFITNADPTWPLGRLSDLITVKYGKDHKKLDDGPYPVYGSGGVMRYVENSLYDKESVLIPRKGTLNNVIYVNEPFWSVDTMFYTEMKKPDTAKFVYHFVKSKDLASLNAGSAVPSMTTDILNAMELLIPDAETLNKFENLVSPMFQTIQHNNKETKSMAAVRGYLFSKLMSGEVDVSKLSL